MRRRPLAKPVASDYLTFSRFLYPSDSEKKGEQKTMRRALHMTRAATALANVGPGFGDHIGPSGNFAGLNDTAKWLLAAAMLIGRLELMAVYVIFTVQFWRA